MPAPVIYFSPFDPEQQDERWTEWQKDWSAEHKSVWADYRCEFLGQCDGVVSDEWIFENIAKAFPFPPHFLAYHYDDTNRIQINPKRTFYAYMQNDQYGIKRDFVGYGYYVTAHEMLHYTLEKKGIEPRLHHCLFVSPNRDNKSLVDRVAQFLIDEGVSS